MSATTAPRIKSAEPDPIHRYPKYPPVIAPSIPRTARPVLLESLDLIATPKRVVCSGS